MAGDRTNSIREHLHAWMVFLSQIIGSTPAARLIENDFPWVASVKVLNGLLVPQWEDDADVSVKIVNANFPSAMGRILPEDYNLRGSIGPSTTSPKGGLRTSTWTEKREPRSTRSWQTPEGSESFGWLRRYMVSEIGWLLYRD